MLIRVAENLWLESDNIVSIKQNPINDEVEKTVVTTVKDGVTHTFHFVDSVDEVGFHIADLISSGNRKQC